MEEAVRLLRQTQGHILLTTGSKDLAAFTQIEDYPERVFARILPSAENIRQAQALGFRGSHLICMQGPFSVEFNAALLRQIQADWMVTKGFRQARRHRRKTRSRCRRRRPYDPHRPPGRTLGPSTPHGGSPSVPGAAVSSPRPLLSSVPKPARQEGNRIWGRNHRTAPHPCPAALWLPHDSDCSKSGFPFAGHSPVGMPSLPSGGL